MRIVIPLSQVYDEVDWSVGYCGDGGGEDDPEEDIKTSMSAEIIIPAFNRMLRGQLVSDNLSPTDEDGDNPVEWVTCNFTLPVLANAIQDTGITPMRFVALDVINGHYSVEVEHVNESDIPPWVPK